MKALYLAWIFVAASAISCGGPTPAGSYSFDAISPGAQAALPGAEKVILTLTQDGQVTLDAGPMNLLTTTWTAQRSRITFGKGQGLIGAEYRLTSDALVPQKDGKDVPEWRFKRK